jgi:hypothetical protein
MDKKIAGILGAVGTLASLNAAQAATSSDPTEVLKARSYADLLEPIPNAMLALNVVDSTPHVANDKVQLAQYHHHHIIITIMRLVGTGAITITTITTNENQKHSNRR